MPEVDSWLQTPAGACLRRWEEQAFAELVSDLFGYRALQIGLPGVDLLAANRMPLRLHCSPALRLAGGGAPEQPTVFAQPFALPFATASIDLVVLPHALECSPHPHQLLREVERVLVAEGSLLISGFNPWSAWGLRRLLNMDKGEMPWCGRYRSTLRMRDWLKLLGFEVQTVRRGCSIPPFGGESWFERLRWLERPGRRFRPLAGVWLIHGIKRVQGMRLIMPKWRDSPAAVQRLGALSPRSGKSWSQQGGSAANCARQDERQQREDDGSS